MRWPIILLALPALAQDPVVHSDVRQVLVPVTVTGEQGRRIHNLKATDFRILEDGRPQRIDAITEENSSNSTTTSAAEPRHTWVIVVDALHSSFPSFTRVRDALAKFAGQNTTSHSADQYALMVLGRNIKMVEDATTEPNDLLNAIRSAEFPEFIRDSEASNAAAIVDEFISLVQGDYCNLCGGCGGRPPRGNPGCSEARARVQAALASFSARTWALDLDFLGLLGEIVRSTARFEGSRTVVFISDGFARFPGRELYSILRNGYGVRDTAFEADPHDTQPSLEAVLKLATDLNVRFYTLDSRGPYTSATTAGAGFSATSSLPTARENTDALAELAHQTGGLFYENSNDLLKGIRQAVNDGRDYYLIAYTPDNKSTAETWRKITVIARNPQLHITAKPGYWPNHD